MSSHTVPPSLVIETPRGPYLVGRRTSIYVIFDHLKNDCDREFIKKHLRLSDEQLDSAIEYIALHSEEIERDYADILARSEERRKRYEELYQERSIFDRDLPVEKRVALMRHELISRQQRATPSDDSQNSA